MKGFFGDKILTLVYKCGKENIYFFIFKGLRSLVFLMGAWDETLVLYGKKFSSFNFF